jgi:hypothetical protein
MTREEIDFLLSNRINFDSVKLGFTRNIPFDVLGKYEELYRKYQDPQFVLTYWCGSCVFDMLERLIRFCESDKDCRMAFNGMEETICIKGEVIEESHQVEKKKRGRPKK